MTVKIALVNDHPLVLAGLRAMLRPYHELEVVELDARRPIHEHVDLALVDTHGLSRDLDETIRERLAEPTVKRVAVYTWHAEPAMVADALSAGACGVLSKAMPAADLASAVQTLGRGGRVIAPTPNPQRDDDPQRPMNGRDWPGRDAGLSMREAEMVTLITQGLTNEQIAKLLYLSPNSVKSYIRSAYHKIGVDRRSQAVAWGIENGMRPRPMQQSA